MNTSKPMPLTEISDVLLFANLCTTQLNDPENNTNVVFCIADVPEVTAMVNKHSNVVEILLPGAHPQTKTKHAKKISAKTQGKPAHN